MSEISERETEKWGLEGWAWVDDMCEAVGPGTTVFNFKDKIAAAERVCEAAELVERYMMNEALDAALADWRRTKEGA